jgi:hypothetical protein
VHVDDIFERQVAEIEGQSIAAEPLNELEIVEGIGHARSYVSTLSDPGYVAPWELVGAVE